MRRSAAPSQAGVAKRPRFMVPYVKNSEEQAPNTSQTQTSQEENKLGQEKDTVTANATDNATSFKKNNSFLLHKGKQPFALSTKSGVLLHEKENKPQIALSATAEEKPQDVQERYLSVMWCKRSNKKHKKWEGDAVLVTRTKSVLLYDMEGKQIGSSSGYKASDLSALKEDETLVIGGKEIQVMGIISSEHYNSGQCFTSCGSSLVQKPTEILGRVSAVNKKFVKPNLKGSELSASQAPSQPAVVTPRHDPSAPNAIVMPRPSKDHQFKHNAASLPIVDVVVDPHVSSRLRPHQREGILFLYECVMGLREFNGHGAILADDMGLGKTIQCIATIWTLLKQGPYGGKPVVRRALIITPGSLVKNWCQEFKKWLGSERISVFAVSSEQKVEDFEKTAIYPVLVISYEMFVRSYERIQNTKFDIVICDEGHRLKNTNIKTTSLITSLPTRRRIVLTGTPVQNDLQEFYSIVEFCNPGILGTYNAFKKVYEEPIVAGRQPSASPSMVKLGQERGTELNRLISLFMLRRTKDINQKYLPVKCEIVIFCQPSEIQTRMYESLLRCHVFRSCLTGSLEGSPHLVCIGALRQLCNHPALIQRKIIAASETCRQDEDGMQSIYRELSMFGDCELDEGKCSGKLHMLSVLLHNILAEDSKEKIVLVSNHTKTLDELAQFCEGASYQYVRLDGQTPVNKRQEIVNHFNSKYSPERIFLLSSKAGGVGLNLIGASRLILYDIDWNPANDLQAMSRVWRDGQTKPVYIYRLLTTGTIEEKMFQRQIMKQGLSSSVVEAENCKSNNVQFSKEELRDLFRLNTRTSCDTHDLLNCSCHVEEISKAEYNKPATNDYMHRLCQLGARSTLNLKSKSKGMEELMDWKHVLRINNETTSSDWFLSGAHDVITSIFWHKNEM